MGFLMAILVHDFPGSSKWQDARFWLSKLGFESLPRNLSRLQHASSDRRKALLCRAFSLQDRDERYGFVAPGAGAGAGRSVRADSLQ